MAKYFIVLEDIDGGISINANAGFSTDEMLSGKTKSPAVKMGGELVAIVDRHMTELAQSIAQQPVSDVRH